MHIDLILQTLINPLHTFSPSALLLGTEPLHHLCPDDDDVCAAFSSYLNALEKKMQVSLTGIYHKLFRVFVLDVSGNSLRSYFVPTSLNLLTFIIILAISIYYL